MEENLASMIWYSLWPIVIFISLKLSVRNAVKLDSKLGEEK
jgi:hypothetical protein